MRECAWVTARALRVWREQERERERERNFYKFCRQEREEV